MRRKTDANNGDNSIGPSPKTCKRKRMVPVRTARSMSMRTGAGESIRKLKVYEEFTHVFQSTFLLRQGERGLRRVQQRQ
jgi:hypothetical protein